jgi:hypothetical protein
MTIKINRTLMAIFVLFLCLGCSGKTTNPVIQSEVNNSINLPVDIDSTPGDNHHLAGIWTASFNLDDKTVSIEPNRAAMAHFNVTQLIAPLDVFIIFYDVLGSQNLEVDVTISNPYPVDVYDLRLIIFTDAYNHTLSNFDNWTPLYDIPGGLPINPFKAYNITSADRKFSGLSESLEKLFIYCPDSNFVINFAVDVSYPGHCEEPYEIGRLSQEPLNEPAGSSAKVRVWARDWQDDVSTMYLYCPAINSSVLQFTRIDVIQWETIIQNQNGISSGFYDAYVMAKSANSGNLGLFNADKIQISKEQTNIGWASTWGSNLNDKGKGIATDSQGNVFISGYFRNSVDFDPGSEIDLHESYGGDDIFLVKYDNNGIFQWARTWGSNLCDWTSKNDPAEDWMVPRKGIDTDFMGNVYVSGAFRGVVDFDPGPGDEIHISNGGEDSFISKFDTHGNHFWTLTWGGTENDTVYEGSCAMRTDNQYIYITGRFNNTVDFDPGLDEDTHTAGPGGAVYLSKFDLNGNHQWAATWLEYATNNFIYGVCSNSDGDIFVTGIWKGGYIDFDPGPGEDLRTSCGHLNCFISKLNSQGDYQWARTWSDYNSTSEEVAWDIEVSDFPDSPWIYVCGYFDGIVDFDPGPGFDLRESSTQNAFICSYDTYGNYRNVVTWDYRNEVRANDLSISKDQHLFVTSYFSTDCDFDPGPDEFILTAEGYNGALSKFDLSLNFNWALSIDGVGDDYTNACTTDDSNNVFVTGYFQRTCDFDPGDSLDEHLSRGKSDAYVVKFLPNGNWE